MPGGWKRWAAGALVALFIIKAPQTAGHLLNQSGHALAVLFGSLHLH